MESLQSLSFEIHLPDEIEDDFYHVDADYKLKNNFFGKRRKVCL